ncbi:pantoate--beta-alanine ligase [Peribacillus sp. FSL H8-0477]|uniref:pantoate--beta-alanine ligase n=1 Tax=Peribacillus sp. FSL H8-0477 TaxID=2921388 RepID=UPI0030F9C33C
MKIITTITELQQNIREDKQKGKTIGFVPTMGFLHEGHQRLIKQARGDHDTVIVSIFVNPLQFGPNEDFESYPRDRDRDAAAAEEAGADYMFCPTVAEMYGSESVVKATAVKRTEVLCGKRRPGHFDGVVTVLTKLFNITTPDTVYFGKKDAQQVAIVDALVRDFNFPIKISAVDTVRDEDGLAKSSRNVYLLNKEREEAKELYQGLLLGKEAIERGERQTDTIIKIIKEHIETTTSGEIDYIELYQYPELTSLETLSGTILVALAVKFQKARLIDNLILSI